MNLQVRRYHVVLPPANNNTDYLVLPPIEADTMTKGPGKTVTFKLNGEIVAEINRPMVSCRVEEIPTLPDPRRL